MFATTTDPVEESSRPAAFQTTHWSVVLAAGEGSSVDAQDALEKLCKSYWLPLYAFARRQGHSVEDAQDLTQEFFARFLARGSFALANRERGRLRTFLLTSLKNFITQEWRRATRLKRGGVNGVVSLADAETPEGENREAVDPREELSPDRLFDRRWAEALLERVMERLKHDYESTGRAAVYARLQQFLWGRQAEISYAEMGLCLGLSEGAIKVAVHRLRQRFRELLREEVAKTVETPEEVEEELRYLLGAFGG